MSGLPATATYFLRILSNAMNIDWLDRAIISYYYKRLTDVVIFAREKLKALDDRDRDKPGSNRLVLSRGWGMVNIKCFV